MNFDPSEKVWFERAGANRGYSHFVYKDVLFLMLSTEDPPKKDVEKELADKYHAIKTGELKETEEILKTIVELEAWAGQVNISDAQVEYFKKVLADHSKVRWTIAFMHTPCWEQEDPGTSPRSKPCWRTGPTPCSPDTPIPTSTRAARDAITSPWE